MKEFEYLLILNVLTFILYGIDKRRARNGDLRIPEVVLLGLAVIGGSIGALVGMEIWHHKTRHLKFRIGIPIIFFLHLAMLIFLTDY